MKKILLVLSILLTTTSLTYATNGNIKVKSENELSSVIGPSGDSNLSNTPSTVTFLGKGDSFLAAFGMETSQGTTGTTGGTGETSSSAGSTTVALTVTSSEATSLTSIQNTPYGSANR